MIYTEEAETKEEYAIRAILEVAFSNDGAHRCTLVDLNAGISESTQYRCLKTLVEADLLEPADTEGSGKILRLGPEAEEMLEDVVEKRTGDLS